MNKFFLSTMLFVTFSANAKMISCPPPGVPLIRGLEVKCEYTTEQTITKTAMATCRGRNFKLEIYKGEAMCVKEKRRKTVIKDKAKCARGTMDNATGVCTWVETNKEKNILDNAVLN